MKNYTETELEEQRKLVRRIIETGTPEEVKKLKEALKDPNLHPNVRNLILEEMALCEREAAERNAIRPTAEEAGKEGLRELSQKDLDREIDSRRAIREITRSLGSKK